MRLLLYYLKINVGKFHEKSLFWTKSWENYIFVKDYVWIGIRTMIKYGWCQAQTGHWEHCTAGHLARCSVFFYYYYIVFFAFPMWSFPIVAFPNKSIINHKSVSLDWLFTSVPCLRQTVLNRVDARDSRKERKLSEITDLFRASRAGQFHL